MRHTFRFCAALLWATAAYGQAASALPEFEVASIKPVQLPAGMPEAKFRAIDMMQDMMVGMVPLKGMTVTMDSRTLQQLVATAYKVRTSDVTGPGWISELRFSLEAKLPAGSDTKTANLMLQSLLEQRFGLKIHHETRNASGYALVAAKDGVHLAPAAPPDPSANKPGPDGRPDPEESKRRMEKMMADMKQSGRMMASTWRSSSATSAQIAASIARIIKVPVEDQTGLDGKYDISIEVPQPETPDESIEYRTSKAIAKYGLKLEARKISTDTIVVDAATKAPTDN